MNVYMRYYGSQVGGQLPAFQGARRSQYGAGLGSILSGIFRTLVPIALRGAGTLLNETFKARKRGRSWKGAVTSAIEPTAMNVLDSSAQAVQGRIAKAKRARRSRRQSGGGRGVKRTRKTHPKPPKHRWGRRSRPSTKPPKPRKGFKGYKRKPGAAPKRGRRRGRRINFLNF